MRRSWFDRHRGSAARRAEPTHAPDHPDEDHHDSDHPHPSRGRRRSPVSRWGLALACSLLVSLVFARPGWTEATYSSLTSSFSTGDSTPKAAPTVGLGDLVEPTLVTADFDALPTGRVTPDRFIFSLGGSNNAPREYDDTTVVPDDRGRGKVLRTTLDAHSVRRLPRGNNGIVVFIPLPRRVQSACLTYDVKFDRSFDWSLGGKLPGLLGVAPGVQPALPTGGHHTRNLGWSGRLMWLGPGAYAMPGRKNMVATYMYSPEQESRYGDNVWWNASFVAGRWHTIKQCYGMNTVGRRDGTLRSWLDGRLVVDRTDYVFRTREDVDISHISWSIFRGGHTMEWAGARTGTIDIDNVRVTGS